MEVRLVQIEYDENEGAGSYTHIGITNTRGENVKVFDSGDVVADWAAMDAWLRANPLDPSKGRTMYTSSVDHFMMDVTGYKWIEDENGRDLIAAMTPEEAAEQKRELEEEEDEDQTVH